MGYYFADGAGFLVETIFELFVAALILRVLFQMVLTRADYSNPVWQGVVKATGPVLHPLRRLIPGYKGVDIAAILLMVVVKVLEIYCLAWLNGSTPGPVGVLVMAIASILQTVIYIFLGAIFIAVVLSWISSGSYNAFTSLVYGISEPALRPLRDALPPMGGLDLSPLVMIIILNLTLKMLIAPLMDFAYSML